MDTLLGFYAPVYVWILSVLALFTLGLGCGVALALALGVFALPQRKTRRLDPVMRESSGTLVSRWEPSE
jgi:hypothetical protein